MNKRNIIDMLQNLKSNITIIYTKVIQNIKEQTKSGDTETQKSYSQYILYGVIIVLINVVGLTLYFRIDLTKNSVYSLSPISKEVVSSLEEPLTIKIFFNKDLPAPYNAVYRYLQDLMVEYDNAGNRYFHYEFVDVEKQKDAASDFGIYPVQIREIRNDQVKFRNAFMGLAIIHGDLIEKIDSITEPEGLEYRITTLIKKMNGKIDSLLKLKNPITVTLYASSNLPIPGMQNLNERVYAEVQKCNIRNYNKIQYRYIDPLQDPQGSTLAQMYGLPTLRWPRFTTMEGKIVEPGEGMVGIVVECNNKFETVQILSRSIFGQYSVGDLTRLEDTLNAAIDNLISINPKVGYIVGHGERDINDEQNGAAQFRKMIGDMYELVTIDITKDEIPDDIATIIINGPRSMFSEYELYKIDQFLMRGGSAVMLLDSYVEQQMQGMQMFQRPPQALPVFTGLEGMLAHYGVKIGRDIVMDKQCFIAQQRGLGELTIYFAPMISEEGLSKDNEITKYLKKIVFLKASSISVDETLLKENKASVQYVVKSSPYSWLQQGNINFLPWGANPPQDSSLKQYNLAVLVQGNLKSYFADKQPKIDVKTKETKGKDYVQEEALKQSVKPVKLFVAGTSEITGRNIIDEEGKSPNAVFMHNVIDYMQGNYAIPQMRSKGLSFNPIKETSDTAKSVIKGINIAGLPLLVILAGVLYMWRRTIRRRRIEEQFSSMR
ncbi:MAG TPA: Gldg family protein [Spirochaetota bacterium]|nr:Gldg family protein [Spirochaetota bacterium]HOM08845.1 Gldg family protein [Spirochaetota bacterium]HPP49401.1 Gldg family protein [Spirochaetota bacterium]HXK65439.1 Gldg family protein [Spirochaetota bacterium]